MQDTSTQSKPEWQAIETAPRDGPCVILVQMNPPNPYGGWPFMGEFRDGAWRIHIDGQIVEPTHWMHMPEPPS